MSPEDLKMSAKNKNTGCIAYIDGANLHKGIQSLGWELDYKKFYVWLTNKYKVQRVYIFLGHIPKHQPLYNTLTVIGYDLFLKKSLRTLALPKGTVMQRWYCRY